MKTNPSLFVARVRWHGYAWPVASSTSTAGSNGEAQDPRQLVVVVRKANIYKYFVSFHDLVK